MKPLETLKKIITRIDGADVLADAARSRTPRLQEIYLRSFYASALDGDSERSALYRRMDAADVDQVDPYDTDSHSRRGQNAANSALAAGGSRFPALVDMPTVKRAMRTFGAYTAEERGANFEKLCAKALEFGLNQLVGPFRELWEGELDYGEPGESAAARGDQVGIVDIMDEERRAARDVSRSQLNAPSKDCRHKADAHEATSLADARRASANTLARRRRSR